MDPTHLPTSSLIPLNSSSYLYQPSDWEASSTTRSDHPSTTVICSWMNAQMKHVLKYTDGYRLLFPQSRLLLITADLDDMFYRTDKSITRNLREAIQVLSMDGSGRVLAHALSVGGAKKLWLLCTAYWQQTGIPPPFHRIILDSAPGVMHFRRTISTFQAGHSTGEWLRFPVTAALRFVTGILWVARELGLKDDVARLWEGLNQLEVPEVNKRRCYIYSQGDQSIRWKDVERHAEEARKQGWTTRMERFHDSRHVQHMRRDPARYWAVIMEFVTHQ